MTNEKEDIEEDKTICPFCLIELENEVDWQKFFLIISGYDDIQLNELLLLTDKANEILRKEVARRTGIKNYESQAQQQQQPFPPPMVQGEQAQGQPLHSFPPNARQMVENIILKKWVNKLCPFCRKQQWIVNEQIFQLTQWQQGAIIIGGGMKVQPIISIICQNCGYTTISNAVITGLVKPQPPKPPG